VVLPSDRDAGISFFDADRLGSTTAGQPCSELIGRIEQPGITGLGNNNTS
jgi:hypothetical protein